jgi:hypothetical protein
VTSVLGTGASGQVLLFTTVLLGASAVLFTIATIATEHNTQVSTLLARVADPDPHYSEKLDPDPHQSQMLRRRKIEPWRADAHSGDLEDQNGALEGLPRL